MWHVLFQWFVKITGGFAWWIVNRPKMYFEDKSVQKNRIKGKAIIISNHTSVLDVGTMLFTFWRRTPRCLVAELMYRKNAFMSFFLKGIGGIRVDRDSHDFSFVQKSCDVLEKGGVIEIYPESRLPKAGEETPLPFKPSATYIALQSGAPIIPVYQNGKLFSKTRLRVIIGKPIDVAALYDESLSEKENYEKITNTLRERIIELGYELERKTQNKKEKGKENQ